MKALTLRHFVKSLGFRVGLIITITELIMLSIIAVVYFNNFNTEVERRLEEKARLPLQLLNAGVLPFEALSDAEQMRSLVGEDVINTFVVGVNDNIFFSLDPQYIGQRFSDQADFQIPLQTLTEITLFRSEQGQIQAAAPLYGADGRTVRFFGVLQLSTARAAEQRSQLVQLFVFGSLITVLATTSMLYLMFNLTIFSRVQTTIDALNAVEKGDLHTRIAKPGQDEIGALQTRLNSMIARLEESFNTLEERVRTRTHNLTVSAEVSRQLVTDLSTETLFKQIATLTRDSFQLYQANVYLYQPESHTLRLAFGTGEAGAAMLADHKYFNLVDSVGLVPLAGRTLTAAVVNDVTKSPDHNPNILLPDTHAEAAFPILYGSDLLGVLDLQADTIGRFGDSEIQLFTSFANQIAVAIRNAALFEQAEKARKRAERSDSVKSAFLASMSHELRTPLNAIINFAKFLRRGVPGPINERQEQYISSIAESGQHLLNLINDVLDMSKIEADSLQLFVEDNLDMSVIIQDAVGYTRSLLGDKPIDLIVNLPEAVPLLTGDRKRLLQVLLNVLSNAAKFTDQGSITLTASVIDSAVCISIADTGMGIAPADHEAVFRPFEQTESGLRQGNGTGLGMPISKKLVEAHGGQLSFESQLGQGTTFYIHLPVKILE